MFKDNVRIYKKGDIVTMDFVKDRTNVVYEVKDDKKVIVEVKTG